MDPAPDAPRLYLITPPIGDAAAFKPLLEAALGAADIACVLLRVAARDEGEAKAILRVLVPVVQAHDAAALIERDTESWRHPERLRRPAFAGIDAAYWVDRNHRT